VLGSVSVILARLLSGACPFHVPLDPLATPVGAAMTGAVVGLSLEKGLSEGEFVGDGAGHKFALLSQCFCQK
jgi:hypothetical protein